MRSIATTFSGLLVVCSTLSTACGGGDAPEQGSPDPLSQAPDLAVNAYCAGYGSCCASKGFAFDTTSCASLLRPQFVANSICPAPGIYDPQAARDCFAEVQATFATCSRYVPNDSPCARVCSGPKAPGSACTRTTECAVPANGTAGCAVKPGETAGTCATEARVKVGEHCNETCTDLGPGSSSCKIISSGSTTASPLAEAFACVTNDGLYCASDQTCKPTLDLGVACASGADCVMGAHCSQSTFVCVANVATGAACPAGNECSSDAYCASDHTCTAKKAAGEACANYTECQGACGADGICAAPISTVLDVTAASCASPTVN